MIPLSSRESQPVSAQVADGLRRLLRAGAYRPGEALPGPADLAAQLTVNPQAAREAYRRLEEEGWLEQGPEGAVLAGKGGKTEGASASLLDAWDVATRALLTRGYSRKELDRRLKEVQV